MFVAVNITPKLIKENTSILNVEISRIVREIERTGNIPDANNYRTISRIEKQTDGENFFESKSEYVIREVDGTLYRFEYIEGNQNNKKILYINIVLGVFSLVVLIILFYIRYSILKPFAQITELPYQLSKGNLTIPLKENKNRFFGKFLWDLICSGKNLKIQNKPNLNLRKRKKQCFCLFLMI